MPRHPKESTLAPSGTEVGRSGPRFGLAAAGLCFLVLVSRLPFVGAGYGQDPDAWRVALAARRASSVGTYVTSRPPGFPIHELVCTMAWRGGARALNGLSALFGTLATLAMALCLRQMGSRDALPASLAMAFTPIVFVASTVSLDYVWGLAFGLAAIWLALRGNHLWAGVTLGLAVGCRLSWILLLAPLLMLLRGRAGSWVAAIKPACKLSAAAVGVAMLAYAPVVWTLGGRWRLFYDFGYPDWSNVLHKLTHRVWGVVGSMALAGAVVASALIGRRPPPQASVPTGPPWGRAAFLVGIGLYVASFLRLPYEAAYLLPVVPLVLLFLAVQLPRAAFQVVCGALLLSPVLLSVVESPIPGSDTFGEPGWSLQLRGPLLSDHLHRRWSLGVAEQILSFGAQEEEETVIIAGSWFPMLWHRLGTIEQGSVQYRFALSRSQLRQLAANEIKVLVLPGQRAINVRVRQVDPVQEGAKELELGTQPDRGRSPGERRERNVSGGTGNQP